MDRPTTLLADFAAGVANATAEPLWGPTDRAAGPLPPDSRALDAELAVGLVGSGPYQLGGRCPPGQASYKALTDAVVRRVRTQYGDDAAQAVYAWSAIETGAESVDPVARPEAFDRYLGVLTRAYPGELAVVGPVQLAGDPALDMKVMATLAFHTTGMAAIQSSLVGDGVDRLRDCLMSALANTLVRDLPRPPTAGSRPGAAGIVHRATLFFGRAVPSGAADAFYADTAVRNALSEGMHLSDASVAEAEEGPTNTFSAQCDTLFATVAVRSSRNALPAVQVPAFTSSAQAVSKEVTFDAAAETAAWGAMRVDAGAADHVLFAVEDRPESLTRFTRVMAALQGETRGAFVPPLHVLLEAGVHVSVYRRRSPGVAFIGPGTRTWALGLGGSTDPSVQASVAYLDINHIGSATERYLLGCQAAEAFPAERPSPGALSLSPSSVAFFSAPFDLSTSSDAGQGEGGGTAPMEVDGPSASLPPHLLAVLVTARLLHQMRDPSAARCAWGNGRLHWSEPREAVARTVAVLLDVVAGLGGEPEDADHLWGGLKKADVLARTQEVALEAARFLGEAEGLMGRVLGHHSLPPPDAMVEWVLSGPPCRLHTHLAALRYLDLKRTPGAAEALTAVASAVVEAGDAGLPGDVAVDMDVLRDRHVALMNLERYEWRGGAASRALEYRTHRERVQATAHSRFRAFLQGATT